MKKSVKLVIILLFFIGVLFNGNIVKALDETTLFSNGGTKVYYGATNPSSMAINESTVKLSGSSLVRMPYLFCCQHGSDINGIYDYAVGDLITKENDAEAYILSNKKFANLNPTLDWDKASNARRYSRAQQAFWHYNDSKIDDNDSKIDDLVEEVGTKSYNAGIALYNQAKYFEDYRIKVKDNDGLLIKKVDTTISYRPEYQTIGPLKVNYVVCSYYVGNEKKTYSCNFEIKGIKNGTETNLNATDDYEITSDKEGKKSTTIKSNTNFYIKIKNTNITKVTSMNIKLSGRKAYAKYHILTYNGKQETCFVRDAKVIEYSESVDYDINQDLNLSFDLSLKKIDEITQKDLSGVKFNINFKNIQEITGYSIIGDECEITNYILDKGTIKFKSLANITESNPVIITITENEPPDGYKKLDKSIVLKIYKNDKNQVTMYCGNYEGASIAYVSNNSCQINATIPNTPLMNLSGKVWLDKFNGEYKKGATRNGKYDNGEGFAKINVSLYNGETEVATTTTDADGTYEFKDIEIENYTVKFEYDGIKYTTVLNSNDNDVTENKVKRGILTNEYGTIDGKTVVSNDTITAEHSENYLDEYKSKTVEPPLSKTVNCGLQERIFDLSLTTDVDKATVKINGKTTDYNYDQILNAESTGANANRFLLGEDRNNGKPDINYNLNLYTSDYNYRIDDYINNLPSYLKSTDKARNEKNYNDINQLSVDVTYRILLTNQSILESKGLDKEANVYVTGVKDYFDSSYTLKKVEFKSFTNDKTIDSATTVGTLEGDTLPTTDNNILDLTGNSTLAGINIGGTSTPEKLNNAVIYLTFSVKLDDKGIIALGDKGNLAEISSYSTSTGMIDIDSAPDNCDKGEHYEDDTDDAPLLKIGLQKNEKRVISGTVFEDSNKDGNNNDSKPVNDVIVQLIELKELDGQTYEYIWQQTTSGGNNVKKLIANGDAIEEYTVNDNGAGQYKFTDFIPGNYIVRFIYGDGRTYTIGKENSEITDVTNENINSVSANVKKYNGQDYKSTKYTDYANTGYYNLAKESYNKDISVARDNEARRLEVMAYSATIDNTIGSAIANKTEDMLNNTWMCAETLKINVPVDASNLETDSDETAASSSGTGYKFDKINFGLELRPKTKLVLEKHITGLKVQPTSGPALLDATASIDDILTDKDTKNGVTKGLSTIVSKRQNRGFWKLETDLEELAQGTTVEVTYTYVVKNEGDEDYLSNGLVQKYKDNIGKNENNNDVDDYADELVKLVTSDTKQAVRSDIGKYLGEFYYKGTANTTKEYNPDTLVPTRAEEIEEALNNKLSLDTAKVDSSKWVVEHDIDKVILGTDKILPFTENDEVKINTIVKSKEPTNILTPSDKDTSKEPTNILTPSDKDTSKTLTLNTTLSSVSTDSAQLTFDSYIAEITKYTNAAGRADMEIVPGNLKYVHSNNTDITLVSKYDSNNDGNDETPYNEHDEFWGESVIISKPTGQDKLTPIQIIAITTAAVAIIGVGIVLIKKYVIK